jgi:hypothetical protein
MRTLMLAPQHLNLMLVPVKDDRLRQISDCRNGCLVIGLEREPDAPVMRLEFPAHRALNPPFVCEISHFMT